MTVAELVDAVHAQGVEVRVREDGALALRPAGRLPEHLREALRAQRELVADYLAEWRIAGCGAFTVVAGADLELERQRGACVRCGASWTLHGSPDPASWNVVADPDDVVTVAVRFVLATARAIVRGAAR